MSLDARTLLLVGAVLCWILAGAVELLALRSGAGRGRPDRWTLGLLAKGAGLYLIAQRGVIEDLWSISLAHALLMVGPLFFYAALQRVRGAITSRLLIAVMPVCVAILLPAIGFSPEAFPTRVLVIVAAWVFGFSLTCWSAYQIARTGYLVGASLILGSNALIAVMAVAFTLAVVANEVVGVFAGSNALLAFYAVTDVCIVLGTFGYMDILRVARNQLRHIDEAQSDRQPGPI